MKPTYKKYRVRAKMDAKSRENLRRLLSSGKTVKFNAKQTDGGKTPTVRRVDHGSRNES